VRSEGEVRDVIERDCGRRERLVLEGDEESTRNAARRRQILAEDSISGKTGRFEAIAYMVNDMVETDADFE